MSRWLALAETAKENTNSLPDNQTNGDESPMSHPQVAFCRVLSGCQVEVEEADAAAKCEFSRRLEYPDTDAFEERAAIAEFDGGLARDDAEQLAAQCQGFENVVAFGAAKKDWSGNAA